MRAGVINQQCPEVKATPGDTYTNYNLYHLVSGWDQNEEE